MRLKLYETATTGLDNTTTWSQVGTIKTSDQPTAQEILKKYHKLLGDTSNEAHIRENETNNNDLQESTRGWLLTLDDGDGGLWLLWATPE